MADVASSKNSSAASERSASLSRAIADRQCHYRVQILDRFFDAAYPGLCIGLGARRFITLTCFDYNWDP
jgi:hypothetical protein